MSSFIRVNPQLDDLGSPSISTAKKNFSQPIGMEMQHSAEEIQLTTTPADSAAGVASAIPALASIIDQSSTVNRWTK